MQSRWSISSVHWYAFVSAVLQKQMSHSHLQTHTYSGISTVTAFSAHAHANFMTHASFHHHKVHHLSIFQMIHPGVEPQPPDHWSLWAGKDFCAFDTSVSQCVDLVIRPTFTRLWLPWLKTKKPFLLIQWLLKYCIHCHTLKAFTLIPCLQHTFTSQVHVILF